MPQVRYSKHAEADLADIITYTRESWSKAQAEDYFNSLVNTFSLLAEHISIGRLYSTRHPDWRRFEHASHVILYQAIATGIRIQRVMHKRQLLERASH